MNKIQNFRQNRFGDLDLKIGIYLGFGVCHLEFQSGSESQWRRYHEHQRI